MGFPRLTHVSISEARSHKSDRTAVGTRSITLFIGTCLGDAADQFVVVVVAPVTIMEAAALAADVATVDVVVSAPAVCP